MDSWENYSASLEAGADAPSLIPDAARELLQGASLAEEEEGDNAPTANLYQKSPGGEVLQLCWMRSQVGMA
jgi:hypothetical protein